MALAAYLVADLRYEVASAVTVELWFGVGHIILPVKHILQTANRSLHISQMLHSHTALLLE